MLNRESTTLQSGTENKSEPESKSPSSHLVITLPDVQLGVLKKYNLLTSDTKTFVDTVNRLQTRQLELTSQVTQLPSNDSRVSALNTELASIKVEREILLAIAHASIRHIEKTGGTPQELREIVEFTRIHDDVFIQFLLSCLLKPCLFSNHLFLQTLKLVILALDQEFYKNNIDTLLKITKILEERIQNMHKHAQSYHDLIDAVEALHVTWLALNSGNLRGTSREHWSHQVEFFKTLSNHEFKPIAYRAKLMSQSLIRIEHDKDPAWKERLLLGYQVLSGIAKIAEGIRSIELGTIAEGAGRIVALARNRQITRREWFEGIILLEAELSIATTSLANFKNFVTALVAVLDRKEREMDLSYGAFELIQRIVLNNAVNPEIVCEAILTLEDMYCDKEKWHTDRNILRRKGLGNGDSDLREQVLFTLSTLTLSKNETVARTARTTLSRMHTLFTRTRTKGMGSSKIRAFMPNGVYSADEPVNIGLVGILKHPDILSIEMSHQLLGHFIGELLPTQLAAAQHRESVSAGEKKEEYPWKTILLHAVPQLTVHTMPRQVHIELMEKSFKREEESNRKPIVIIQGIPGIGKTQLALSYANKHKDYKSFVLWIYSDADPFKQWIDFGAMVLGESIRLMPREQQLKAIREMLAAQQNWLIVFDHIENEEALKGFLPDALGVAQHVLITTCSPDWENYCNPVVLQPLMPNEVDSYFQAMDVQDNSEDLQALAEALEYNPLALSDAVAYMNLYHATALQCLELYLKRGIKLFPKKKANEANRAHYHATTAATYHDIIEKLKVLHRDSVTLIIYCAYLNADRIEFPLLYSIMGIDEENLERLMIPLRQHGLISVEQTHFKMSRLTQAAIRDHVRMLPQKTAEKELKKLVKCFCVLYPIDKNIISDYHFTHLLMPHIEAIILHLTPLERDSDLDEYSVNAHLLKLYDLVFDYHRTVTGNADSSYAAAEKILAMRAKVYETTDPAIADAQNKMGVAYYELGDAESALDHHKQALDIYAHAEKKHDVEVGETNYHLGKAYFCLNQVKLAENFEEKAFKTCSPSLRPLTVLYLGKIYHLSKSPTYAIGWYQQHLSQLDEKHPFTAEVYSSLVFFYISVNRMEEASNYHKKALELRLQIYGEKHNKIAENHVQLGMIYSLKQPDKAVPYFKKALEIYNKNYTKPHPAAAEVYVLLGKLYKQEKNKQLASQNFESALQIYTKLNRQNDMKKVRDLLGELRKSSIATPERRGSVSPLTPPPASSRSASPRVSPQKDKSFFGNMFSFVWKPLPEETKPEEAALEESKKEIFIPFGGLSLRSPALAARTSPNDDDSSLGKRKKSTTGPADVMDPPSPAMSAPPPPAFSLPSSVSSSSGLTTVGVFSTTAITITSATTTDSGSHVMRSPDRAKGRRLSMPAGSTSTTTSSATYKRQ